MLREPWLNEDPAARAALLAELNAKLGGTPRVLSGSEVWFGDDLVELYEKGAAGPLTTLAGSRALLVEFPPGWVSPQAGAVFHELRVMGVVPVVAHPERNLVFAHEPERLAALVERGAVVQVTAAARERVRKVWGAEVEEGLFLLNPSALLAGADLPWAG